MKALRKSARDEARIRTGGVEKTGRLVAGSPLPCYDFPPPGRMAGTDGGHVHIADGIIATEICLAADAACLGALYVMGRDTDSDEIPRMGFVGAALFAVSLVHFPVAGTAMHLSLLGLAGLLLGLRALPVVFLALLFQALIFQHGGLITLGLNTLNMSVGAVAAWGVWRALPAPQAVRGFLAGVVGILLPATLVIGEFYITGYGRGILVLYGAYAVSAVVEGFLTASVVAFLRRAQPEILEVTPS